MRDIKTSHTKTLHLERAREGIDQHALARRLPEVLGHVAQQYGRVGADGRLLVNLRYEMGSTMRYGDSTVLYGGGTMRYGGSTSE